MTLITFPSRSKGADKGMGVTQNSKPFLSTEDVAHLLGFSVRTITAWALAWHESGGAEGIPAFKMGRSWRFDRQQIEAFIHSKQAPVQSTGPKSAIA